MPVLQTLLLISVPRSGTNFFCECLDTLDGAEAYHELFNPRGAFDLRPGSAALARFAPHLGHIPADARDPALVRFFHRNPHAALDVLADHATAGGHALMAYKVFPKQVPLPVLATLMARPATRVGFIRRSRIDVFISYEKARQQQAWKHADTTDVRPEIALHAFLAWAAEADRWFDDTARMAAAAGVPVHHWRYDTQIDVGKAALVAALAAEFAAAGIAVSAPRAVGRTRHIRQDLADRPFRKIANGPALRAALRTAGRLRYARDAPAAG